MKHIILLFTFKAILICQLFSILLPIRVVSILFLSSPHCAPRLRQHHGGPSFLPLCSQLWNSLPPDMRNIGSLPVFHSQLKLTSLKQLLLSDHNVLFYTVIFHFILCYFILCFYLRCYFICCIRFVKCSEVSRKMPVN